MFSQRLLLFAAVALATLTSTSATGGEVQNLRRLEGALTLDKALYDAMLARVNKERSKAGLKPLCYNKKLKSAGQAHTQDQANVDVMSHTGSDGSTIEQRIKRASYKWDEPWVYGENVAAGYSTVDIAMDAWMGSSGHRANILKKEYTHFGLGYAYTQKGTYHHYWTQMFGAGASETCEESGGDADSPTPGPITPKPTASTPTTGRPKPRPTRKPRNGQ